jgi:drug/metabolite transporter, DME family
MARVSPASDPTFDTTHLGCGGVAPPAPVRARLCVVGAAVLWGTTGTAQALGPDGASSLAVGSARAVAGGAVLLVVARVRGRGWLGSITDLPAGPLAGATLAMAAYQLCFFGGVRLAGVAIGTVVGVGSAPVWGGVLGWLVRGERPGRRWALATGLAVPGAALLATSTVEGGDRVDPGGIALALAAGLAYATFALFSKGLTDRVEPDRAMTWTFALSGLLLLPVGLVAGVGPLLTPGGALMVAHLGVLSLAVAYLLFGRGIAGVTVATATTLSLAEPLTASTLGVVVLDERLSPAALVGAALVLAGLVALTVRSKGGRAGADRPPGAARADRVTATGRPTRRRR